MSLSARSVTVFVATLVFCPGFGEKVDQNKRTNSKLETPKRKFVVRRGELTSIERVS